MSGGSGGGGGVHVGTAVCRIRFEYFQQEAIAPALTSVMYSGRAVSQLYLPSHHISMAIPTQDHSAARTNLPSQSRSRIVATNQICTATKTTKNEYAAMAKQSVANSNGITPSLA